MLKYSTYKYFLIFSIAILALLAPSVGSMSFSVSPEVFKTAWAVVGVPFIMLLWFLSDFDHKITIIKTPIYYPIVGFIIWCVVSLIWVVDGYLASIQIVQFTSVTLAFFIVVNSIREGCDIKALLFLMVVSSVLVSILGLSQYYFPESNSVQTFIRQMTSPAATFGNKNMAIHFIVLTLPISIVFFLQSQTLLKSAFFFATLLICGWFLFVSNTRAGWLSVIIQVFLLILFLVYDFLKNGKNPLVVANNKGKPIILIVLLFTGAVYSSVTAYQQEGLVRILFTILALSIFAIMVHVIRGKKEDRLLYYHKIIIISLLCIFMFNAVFSIKGLETSFLKFSERFTSISSGINEEESNRIPAWRNTLELIKDHPVVGVGAGQWSVYYPLYYDQVSKDKKFNEEVRLRHLHNEYLEMLSNVGVIGTLFLLWFFSLVVSVSYKTLVNTKTENRYLVLGMVLALTGFAVTSFFSFPVKVYYPLLLVMVYIGLIVNSHLRTEIVFDGVIAGAYGNNDSVDINPTRIESFSFSGKATWLLLVFSFLLVIVAGITSYKWFMGQHYFNLVEGVELAKYDDPSEKSQIKLQTIEKSIISNPYSSKAQFLAGQILIENQHLDEGIEYLEKSLKGSPNQTLTLRSLFLAYAKKNDLKNMLKVVEKHMEVDPRSVRAHAYATAVYRELGRSADAKRVYLKMKENYLYFKGRYGFGPYYSEVGGTAQAVGDIKYAKEVFAAAIKKFKKDAELHKKLGGLYYLYPKNKAERRKGIDLIKRSLKLNPKISGNEELKKLVEKDADIN